MKVQLAQVAGFCMGVRRAMDMALAASMTARRPVYTFGPLIHNPSALDLLERTGVRVLSEIPEKGEGTVIIRAHGVPPETKRRLRDAGFSLVDATCPRVIKVQMLARHYSSKGYSCLIVGDKGHPEVTGILGYAGENGILVSSEEDVEKISPPKRYVILAQTTQDRKRFARWSKAIIKRHPGGRVIDTICDSTRKRQAEAARLADESDLVVVVGGKKSANTKRLAEIVEERGTACMAVETAEDLDRARLSRHGIIGVTAGASTPNWVITEVVREIESIRSAKDPLLRHAIYRILRFFHEANLWTALAGAGLALAASIISPEIASIPVACSIASCSVFSMHTINRLMDIEHSSYNDPPRARFLKAHKALFALLSVTALLLAHVLAWNVGTGPFLLLLALTASAIFYRVHFLPPGLPMRSLRDLPGSKPLFISVTWGAVAVLVPSSQAFPLPDAGHAGLFLLASLAVFARSLFMEILDAQGDRIAGRETLTLLVGEKKTLRTIRLTSIALAGLALTFSAAGVIRPEALAFLVLAALMYLGSYHVEHKRIRQNLRLEFLAEATFLVLPAAAFLIALLLA